MKIEAKTVKEYILQLSDERQIAIEKLRAVILENIPKGFEECIIYNMIGYVVPHSIYPKGYHCSPELPLTFVNIASQKNFIALYHMGIYGNSKLSEWFQLEYSKHSKLKLDMGKSCIRFKKIDQIPYELIGELMRKITVEQYVEIYESMLNK